jgi:uncharacterized protein (DUF1499 family)
LYATKTGKAGHFIKSIRGKSFKTGIKEAMKQAFIFIILSAVSIATNADSSEKKKLPPCQNTPNCVSSQAEDKLHYIAPFKISGTAKAAWEELRKLIAEHDRIIITHESKTSLHAEATSLVLHFVDDIDAILDEAAGLIHIRSASRVGHSDFGVNRKRIEALRQQLRKIHVIAKLANPLDTNGFN